jgi:hypothetical protein
VVGSDLPDWDQGSNSEEGPDDEDSGDRLGRCIERRPRGKRACGAEFRVGGDHRLQRCNKAGPSNASFFGRVKSEKNACERRRKVTLYYKANGADFSTEMGSGKTNAKGKWIVESVPVMDGSYFATVNAKEIRAGLCKGDTSPNVAFTR